MIDVTIDDDALSMLKKTIDDRMEYKNKHNIKSMRISKKETDKQVWLRGLRGEYALSKLLGSSNKGSLRHSKGGDRGFDFAVNGTTIELKTTKGWNLIVQKDYRRLKGDVIVDAQDIAPDTIRFRGWATRDEFYDRCHQADLKYKDANGSTTRDVMNPEDLNPMETLEEHLHARKDTEMGEPEVP